MCAYNLICHVYSAILHHIISPAKLMSLLSYSTKQYKSSYSLKMGPSILYPELACHFCHAVVLRRCRHARRMLLLGALQTCVVDLRAGCFPSALHSRTASFHPRASSSLQSLVPTPTHRELPFGVSHVRVVPSPRNAFLF